MLHSAEALSTISSPNGKLVNGRPLRVTEARLKADEGSNSYRP
ncbi:MAG TPA: hypothetical protein VMT53_13605 [Terriglobales bacterium]|nr:hypothetical protein [Terriglobales bacterium]